VLDAKELNFKGPGDALSAGIETVYQDLALVDTMSAYQNVYLGREPLASHRLLRLFNLVNDRTMRRQSKEVLLGLGVKIPSVNATVKQMSGGQRQCLAIARAVLWGRRIVILDEPRLPWAFASRTRSSKSSQDCGTTGSASSLSLTTCST